MTTRDDDGATAGAADNSDTEKTTNSINANSFSNNQSSGPTTSTNSGNGSHTRNWFRSIPRRIRKFITKHQNRPVNASSAANNSVANVATTSDAVYANQTFVGDGDGTDDSNLYSMVDYMGNDEEVAMIRACSQMARYYSIRHIPVSPFNQLIFVLTDMAGSGVPYHVTRPSKDCMPHRMVHF